MTGLHKHLIGGVVITLLTTFSLFAQIKKKPEHGSIVLPAGTNMRVRLDRSLHSNMTRQGEEFTAILIKPVYWGRHTVLPAGSKVHGIVADIERPRMGITKASITIVFDRVETPDGRTVPIAAGIPGDFGTGEAMAKGGAFAGKLVVKKALNTALRGLLTPLYVADSVRKGIQFVQEDKEVAIPAGTILEIYLEQPVRVPI